MNRLPTRLLTVILLVCLQLWVPPPLARATLTVGVVAGLGDGLAVTDGKLTGHSARSFNCVFERLEADLDFVVLPLAKLLYQIENGQIDVGLPLAQTPDRDAYADFGGRLLQLEYVYVMLRDLPPLNASSGLTYAFVRKFYGDLLVKGESPRVLGVSGWMQALELLKSGRADVVIMPWVMVNKLMAGFNQPYLLRTAEWVDLSFYVSHAQQNGLLAEELRHGVRQCLFENHEP